MEMWHGNLNKCLPEMTKFTSVNQFINHSSIYYFKICLSLYREPWEILENCNSVCDLNLQSNLGCKFPRVQTKDLTCPQAPHVP